MASVYTNINMTAFNRAQIRKACAVLGILVDNSKSNSTLVTAVKAK